MGYGYIRCKYVTQLINRHVQDKYYPKTEVHTGPMMVPVSVFCCYPANTRRCANDVLTLTARGSTSVVRI